MKIGVNLVPNNNRTISAHLNVASTKDGSCLDHLPSELLSKLPLDAYRAFQAVSKQFRDAKTTPPSTSSVFLLPQV